MGETWNGATRDEFIGRLKLFSKKELSDMMRAEGKRLPHVTVRTTHEELVGLCFDVLVGKDSAAADGSAPSSSPPPAAALRFEVRAKGLTQRVRCGHVFTNRAQAFSHSAFTRAEWEILKADPYLQVKDLTRG